MWIGLCNSARVNGTHIDWHKPIPETEEVISQQIDGFLTRFFCNRRFFLSNAKVDQAEDAKELASIRAQAQTGDAKAQYLLGSRYRFAKGVKQDLPLAVQWYRKSADQGYAPAQSDLGVLYANGRGVTQDEAQAVYWYRKASDLGDGIAQNNLGLMYAEGRGVTKDEAQAVRWFERSAKSGDAAGQSGLYPARLPDPLAQPVGT